MNCIICGNDLSSYQKNPEKNTVYNCKSCNLFNSVPISSTKNSPKDDYMGKFWERENLKEMIRTDFENKVGQDYQLTQESMYSFCRKYLKNRKKILEIGAGTGIHLIMFDKMGYIVTGVEPDPISANFINQKLEHGRCINGFIEDIKLNEKFNVVFLYHVVEHIEDPRALLKKCHDFLEDGGIIIIAVPDCENPENLSKSIENTYHLWHFSQNSLKKLTTKLGYKILTCESFARISTTKRRFHKILRKIHLTKFSKKTYPYYPLIHTVSNDGYEIRLILSKNNVLF